jgi:hypothetical protein
MVDYLHPSVSSTIVDNSTVFVTSQGLTTLFAAFSAPSGPDNRLQLVTSTGEVNFYYGTPNIRNWGQTLYNVSNWLLAGGQALCMRVLPYLEVDANSNPLQQSLYACYIVEVGIKNLSGVKSLKVRQRILGDGQNTALPPSIELGVRDDPSLLNIVLETGGLITDGPDQTPATPTADTSGWLWYPIFIIRGLYRGAAFNPYGVRLELDPNLDNTYPQRLYQLSIYNSPSHVIESFLVSLYPEAVDNSGQSQFLPDVLSTYSATAHCTFSEANYDLVVNFINPNPAVASQIDILTLTERSIVPAPSIHAGTTLDAGTTPLAPSATTFLPMGGGTDGDWLGPNSLESLLYKAYSGTGDFIDGNGLNIYDTHFMDIWDKRRYLVDVTLDGNYPASVKVAMSNFAATRGDLMSMHDTGFTASAAQALAYRTQSLPLNTEFSAIFTQDYVVFDPNSTSEIRVTPTYFLATAIPTVDNAFGIQYPFVGPRRGGIVGFSSQSWIPDDAYMEQLYQAQVNYAETDTVQTAFMSQQTTQIVNSALSDISHVRVLLRIRRELEKMGATYRFEFNDPTTWAQLQYSAQQYMNTWIQNRALTTATALVYASKYDQQQRILRMTASVVFNGIIERVMIEIVVNK